MKRSSGLILVGLALFAAPAVAQGDTDAKAQLACLSAAGFRDARIAPATLRFNEPFAIDARLVSGTDSAGNARAKLCLFDPRTGRAGVADFGPWQSNEPAKK